MSSQEEGEVIDLGAEDSYTEDEIIDVEDSEQDQLNDSVNGDDEEPVDRIGTLANNFSVSMTKQQQVLKAHISILTSALGGIDYSSDSDQYKLGDDALACLKDIKRWLKSVDEQDKKWDVAMACAETGLVVNDLIVILAQWENESMLKKVKNKNYMDKIALAIVELLVPLTWPLRLTKESTSNQVAHYPNLKKYQLLYKKQILSYQDGRALRAVIRLTLPIVSKSKSERSARDNAILRLCIYLFRNVLKIEPANSTISSKKTAKGNQVQDNLPSDVTMEDISLNAVIESYEKNKVLQFLLTLTNLLGSEFDEEMLNMGCLECLYYLIEGVSVKKVFNYTTTKDQPQQQHQQQSKEVTTQSTAHLKDLLEKEQNIRRSAVKNSSSRHGRFGTLLSLQTVDNGRLTVSGQKGLNDKSATLAQLDQNKTWRPTKNMGKSFKLGPNTEMDEKLGKAFTEKFLNSKSIKTLTSFMTDFIEGCFNPLSYSLRRKFLSAEDPSFNTLQYFELITWIVGFETERRIADKENNDYDNGYFTSILEDDFFTLVITSMRKASEEYKQWSLVQSCMKCFKEVLSFADLIGSTSNESNDQLMSHNLKQRLFMKEVTLDLLAALPRNAYKISLDYVITVVELTYVVLKTLEKFSKDDESLYIAAKRARKKKQNPEYSDSEDEDAVSTQTKTLNYLKYQLKFIHKDTIQTHLSLFERYQEVSEQDLKRCLSFFYRVFYTAERHLDLYRMDFMILLHQITGNSLKSLSRTSPLKKEVISFTKYYMKKLVEDLEKAPSLFVELCFYSSFPHNYKLRYFLEHGEVLKEQKTYKVAAEIFFKRGYEIDLDRKFAIVVSLMIDNAEREIVEKIKEELSRIVDKRTLWFNEQRQLNTLDEQEDAQVEKLTPPTENLNISEETFVKLLIKNSRVRLILRTVGFDLPDSVTEPCELPSDITLDHLTISLGSITRYLKEAVKFPEGESAIDYIVKYDDDDEDDENDINYGRRDTGGYDEDDIAFETGQMNIRSERVSELDKLDELESQLSTGRHKKPLGQARRKNRGKIVTGELKKKKTRKPNRYDSLEMHDISDTESPDPRRLQKDFDYKSSEFIQDSDDEDDGEFFAKELFLRDLLELNGGLLKPEHTKLFLDDSWKNYKITVTGDVAKRPAYDNLATLDEIIKKKNSQNTQDGSMLNSQILSDNELSQTPVMQKSQIELDQSQVSLGAALSSVSDGELSENSDLSSTMDQSQVSEHMDTSKRSVDDEENDEEEPVIRKKQRRVLDSDDDE